MNGVFRISGMILLLVLLTGCGERSRRIASNVGIKATDKTAITDTEFWDGGEFAGEPVYSRMRGVSREALEAFVACGLNVQNMKELIRNYSLSGSTRMGYVAGAPVGSGVEPTWSVFMEVEQLTVDVFRLTCQRTE